ncbi:MAG TPA: hypothetical protein VIX90_02915 [Edaphobacter sp.]
MVADPLEAMAILSAGENVEADFGPAGDALGDLDGLVELMVGGVDAVDYVVLPRCGEVGVQLEHRVFCGDGVGSVDLDLVVALGAHCGDAEKKNDEGCEMACSTQDIGPWGVQLCITKEHHET